MSKPINVGHEFFIKSSRRLNADHYEGLSIMAIDDSHFNMKVAAGCRVELHDEGLKLWNSYNEVAIVTLPYGAKAVLQDKKVYSFNRSLDEGQCWQIQK